MSELRSDGRAHDEKESDEQEYLKRSPLLALKHDLLQPTASDDTTEARGDWNSASEGVGEE